MSAGECVRASAAGVVPGMRLIGVQCWMLLLLLSRDIMCVCLVVAFPSCSSRPRSSAARQTPTPLPSIAISDPRFKNDGGNDWSGQPEGLTFQRAIRGLENYGREPDSHLLALGLWSCGLKRGLKHLHASTLWALPC